MGIKNLENKDPEVLPKHSVGVVDNDDKLDLGVGDVAKDLLMLGGEKRAQVQVSEERRHI